ncbi:MAG: DUF2225 domain-containing protein [Spirochaetota bacterium]
MAEGNSGSLSFFSKNAVGCPVCGANFFKEDLKTGRGRLIAGDLRKDFRRLYEPSQKYGAVYPLIYPVMVCPVCYYATFPQDFTNITPDIKSRLEANTEQRAASIKTIFPELDFESPRTLKEGAASYYFAAYCYDFLPPELSPTIKRGIATLRAAWLLEDLHKSFPGDNYDYLAKLFYRKARFFYTLAIEYEQTGKESMAVMPNLGPDIDKNFGYDGVLYLAAYLEYFYGPSDDKEKRFKALESAKRSVARIFGMGKASKDKPTILLESAKELRTQIAEEIGREGADGSA